MQRESCVAEVAEAAVDFAISHEVEAAVADLLLPRFATTFSEETDEWVVLQASVALVVEPRSWTLHAPYHLRSVLEAAEVEPGLYRLIAVPATAQ